jgi:DivIVA domain-containing protein
MAEGIAMDARYLDLIERVKNAQFRTTRLSPGYDEEEVDNLLDRVVDRMRQNRRRRTI